MLLKLENIHLFMFAFLLAGCASGQNVTVLSPKNDIMHAYLYEVQKNDGIDTKEAAVLAQSQLIFNGHLSRCYFDRPEVEDFSEEYWGVSFYPVNKTLGEVSSHPPVFFLVDKKTGSVQKPKMR